MKFCTKCGETKPLSEFYRHRSRPDGLACWCKRCDSVTHAARYAGDPEKKRATAAAWKALNIERNRANAKAWAAANPERARANVKAWRKANPDRVKANDSARRAADPERYKANIARYRERHPERDKASRRASSTRRRAVIAGAEAERFDPVEVLERDGWRCHLCGVATPKRLRGTHDERAPELDHIIPLASGGEHSRRNTACACRRCNVRKSAKPLGQLRMFG